MIVKSENLNTDPAAESIELENVGAISRLTIPLPADGGVVVLHGRNGSGKSTAIAASSALVSGNGKPPLRDGERKGSVSGFGATINLGPTIRRNGTVEAVVDHIEGKFSITDLVDPKHADPKAADRVRIKALLTVRGVEVNQEMFVSLFSSVDDFSEVVSKSSTETNDPVEMSAKVKRDVESHARIVEEKAGRLRAEYDAMVAGSEYDEADIITDLTEHNKTGAELGQQYQKLVAEQKAYISASENIERAKKAIARIDIDEERRRIDTEQALIFGWKTENDASRAAVSGINMEIAALQAQIDELKTEAGRRNDTIVANDKNIAASERIVVEIEAKLQSVEGYQEIAERSASLQPVSESEIEAAKSAFGEHNEKLQRHAVAFENKRRSILAKGKLHECEAAEDRAAELREIARNCELVLTEMIGDGSLLYIEDGRMVVDTHRGKTYYNDLSDGERWKIAFQAIADSVRRNENRYALLTIPQRGWESLDPTNQNLVKRLAKEHRLCILTAEKSDGELSVEHTFEQEEVLA